MLSTMPNTRWIQNHPYLWAQHQIHRARSVVIFMCGNVAQYGRVVHEVAHVGTEQASGNCVRLLTRLHHPYIVQCIVHTVQRLHRNGAMVLEIACLELLSAVTQPSMC